MQLHTVAGAIPFHGPVLDGKPILSSRLCATLRFCYRTPHAADDQRGLTWQSCVLAHVPAGQSRNGGMRGDRASLRGPGAGDLRRRLRQQSGGTRLVTGLRSAMLAKLLAAPTP